MKGVSKNEVQRFWGVLWVALFCGAIGWSGCVEPTPASPNSDQGEFFVDNEFAVAMGWRSHVSLAGPLTGKQHCEGATGICYPDHRAVEVIEVTSEDEAIVDILEFGEHQLGAVQVGRVLVEGMAEGRVKLEAEVKVGSKEVRDSFDLSVAELASIELQRTLAQVAPYSRYALCSNEAEGAYLFDSVTGIEILLHMYKRDGSGKLLRGHGQFPIDVEPAGAVEFFDDEELLHLIRLQPKAAGRFTLRSQKGSSTLSFNFASQQGITGAYQSAFGRDANGQRTGEVGEFVQGKMYDLVVFPLVNNAPLCGGDARVRKEIRTPGQCGFVGAAHPGSEQVIEATQPGECHVVFFLDGAAGGQGLKYDFVFNVIPGEYDGDPGW